VYAVGVAPLDPNGFSSLGSNPFTNSGTYLIDTRATSPTLYDPNTNALATGTIFNGVAVFTFDSILIGTNTIVEGMQNTNSHPYALLSHGDLTIDGIVDASGAAGGAPGGSTGGNGGAAGPGGGGGGGGGPFIDQTAGSGGAGLFTGSNGSSAGTLTLGTGGNGGNAGIGIQGEGVGAGSSGFGGGGAFGGNGGAGQAFGGGTPPSGGTAYGDLTAVLQAGSGGGGAGPFDFEGVSSGGGGGGGGGTVELGSVSNAVVSGTVSANGGGGGDGGGGAGGGILINIPSGNITLSSSARLSAAGGATGGGGGGGGGRINIIATIIDAQGTAVGSFVNVAGGLVFGDVGTGEVGVVTVAGTVCPEVLVVTNTADSGPGSLRQAILDASACPVHHTINFDPAAFGTITLTSGELLVTSSLEILGPGATNVTVDGNAASRVFYINPGLNVTIAGLTITNGLASDNTPGDAGNFGAGIDNDHATLIVSNCTIVGNSAGSYGGAIYNNGTTSGSANLTIINSALVGNSSGGSGGGVLSDGSYGGGAMLTVVNSTVDGNSSYAGGGLNSFGLDGSATMTIYNSTLNGNTATVGGGIVNNETTLEIGSSIVNAGSGSGGNINNGFGTITSLGYNLSSDTGGGFLTNTGDQTNTNPLLGPLQLNGGQTPTRALSCGSPAIDAGTNFLGLTTDQRGEGFPRTFGGGPDIGAFEVQQVCNHPPVAICTNVTVSAGTNCLAGASIDGGSFDPDQGDTITLVQSPPGPYSLGATTVMLTVTDNHGASNSCSATVTVVDTTPPVPNVASLAAVSNQCSASVTAPHATDNCAGPITATTTDPTTYNSQGSFTVHWIYNDGNGNSATQTQAVVVHDTMAPVPNLALLPPVTGQCSASVTAPHATDNCAGLITATTSDPTSYTSQGSATIHWIYRDGNGNSATQTQAVVIKDTGVPGITCPPSVTTNAASTGGVNVSFAAPVVTDNCSGYSVTSSRTSGSLFAIGTTTVTNRVINIGGITNSCTFTVKVESASEQITDLIALVNSFKDVNGGILNALSSNLKDAQSALNAHKTASACSDLEDFIGLASAQSGKHLTVAEANLLIANATRIRAVMGCS
jgi:hypothetical protein